MPRNSRYFRQIIPVFIAFTKLECVKRLGGNWTRKRRHGNGLFQEVVPEGLIVVAPAVCQDVVHALRPTCLIVVGAGLDLGTSPRGRPREGYKVLPRTVSPFTKLIYLLYKK